MSVHAQIWIFNSHSLLVLLFNLLTGHVKMVLPADTTPQMLVAKLILLLHAKDFDGRMYCCSLLLPGLLITYPSAHIIRWPQRFNHQ